MTLDELLALEDYAQRSHAEWRAALDAVAKRLGLRVVETMDEVILEGDLTDEGRAELESLMTGGGAPWWSETAPVELVKADASRWTKTARRG